MGSVVEQAMTLSLLSLLQQDEVLARNVIDGEWHINALEIEIENTIVNLIALQHPVAADLRFILGAEKVNNDLERLGDHAVNIAESALRLIEMNHRPHLFEMPKLAEVSHTMMRYALDAFVAQDPQLSIAVLKHDDITDELNRSMISHVIQLMKNDESTIEEGLELIRTSRNLERVADLSTNIAEEVIFIAQGKLVKHRSGSVVRASSNISFPAVPSEN